jgi:hypothetical protein
MKYTYIVLDLPLLLSLSIILSVKGIELLGFIVFALVNL